MGSQPREPPLLLVHLSGVRLRARQPHAHVPSEAERPVVPTAGLDRCDRKMRPRGKLHGDQPADERDVEIRPLGRRKGRGHGTFGRRAGEGGGARGQLRGSLVAVLVPGFQRFRNGPGEQPGVDAFRIDVEEAGESADRLRGSCGHAVQAVEQVLGRVVGGIADERLGVDGQPRLPLRSQHVAGMQVGEQQNLPVGRARQLVEQSGRRPDQALVDAVGEAIREPGEARPPPRRDERLQRPERMTLRGRAPQTVEQTGDDLVLCGFVHGVGQSGAGLAAFQEQRAQVRVRVEQPDGAVAVPEP